MTAAEARSRLRRRLTLSADGVVAGYVVDPEAPSRRFAVEILADGHPVALLRAQEFRPDLDGEGDGCHGFSFALGEGVPARTRWLEARLANTGDLVGALAPGAWAAEPNTGPRGAARWAGGLRITGWIDGIAADEPHEVLAIVDGEDVAGTACRNWTAIAEGGRFRPVRAFDLHLPARFADGRARSVEVVSRDGWALGGSPCLVFAAADGLADLLETAVRRQPDRVRARFMADLLPQSMPFTAVEAWLDRYPLRQASAETLPHVAAVVLGEAGLGATLASLDGQVGARVTTSVLAGRRSAVGFEPAQLQAALADGAAAAEVIVFAPAGTRFVPEALGLLHEALLRIPDAESVYGDLFVASGDARWPLGFPAFDAELFLEQGYCGLVFAMRPRAVAAALAAAGPPCDTLFRLFLRQFEREPADTVVPVHVPAPLATLPELPAAERRDRLRDAVTAHLLVRGIAADVEAAPDGAPPRLRVRRRAPPPDVSVVVPVRNGAEALAVTLDMLADGPSVHLVLIDNGSVEPAALALIDRAARGGHDVLRVPGPFQPGRLLARGGEAAHRSHILFLRAGLSAATPGWLEEMLGRCAASDVGAVGALVTSEEGLVEEAGLVVGPGLAVVPRFADRRLGDEGYGGWLGVAHQVSALSDACLLTPRAVFAAVGGFDALRFPKRHHDVDYALRLRAAGRRIVLTPHARLIRHGEPVGAPEPDAVAARDLSALRNRWTLSPGCDPFYSPWLAMDGAPYSGLAWPPPFAGPRRPDRPEPVPVPPGF